MEHAQSSEVQAQESTERTLLESSIVDLRSRQQDILIDSDHSEEERVVAIDESVHEYLQSFGLQRESDNYDEYYSVLRSFSIDSMNNIQWRYGKYDEQTKTTSGKTGYDKLVDAQVRLLGRRLDDSLSTEPQSEESDMETLQTEAILHNARLGVNKHRESWAKAASKRAGSGIRRFYKSKKHKNLESEYHSSVQELGKLELQSILEDDSVSAEDKNVAVISFLFDEQKKLREKTLENLKSTKVSKFVECMNKGNIATRIAKGMGIGALAGVTGAFLAGAAGAGIVAAGAVAGSRFVKGYASKDRHRGSHIQSEIDGTDKSLVGNYLTDAMGTSYNTIDAAITDLQAKRTAEIERNDRGDTYAMYDVVIADLEKMKKNGGSDAEFQAYMSSRRLADAHSITNNFFEADVKHEQSKRLKALGVGAVSVVAGAGIGYGIHAGAEWMSGKDLTLVDDAAEKAKNFLQGNGFTAEEMGKTPGEPGPKPEVGELGYNNDFDGDGVINGHDVAPRNVDIGAVDFTEITRDARWIERGEGGFQTLKELGVPEEKWEVVWADAGQHFAEDGKAYIMDDGRYGWSEPGRMTNADITELAKAARRQGVVLNFTLAS